ncbi:hypothetical protein JVU11DRAFT_2326 [Chiua virens]|nr:hypothetical protein JVU11DRAFT_2326 [Chiua virens]
MDFGAPPIGAPPSMNRDPNHAKSLAPHSHDFPSPVTPTSMRPSQSSRQHTKSLLVYGDDEVDVDNIEIDDAHAAAAVAFGMSDLTMPVKLLDRFSVWFPLYVIPLVGLLSWVLKGCGSLSRLSISSSSEGMSVQTTPARTVTPASSVSLPSGKDLNLGDQGNPKVDFKMVNSDCSAYEDAARRASQPMSPGNGLRKDPQGFWESDPRLAVLILLASPVTD